MAGVWHHYHGGMQLTFPKRAVLRTVAALAALTAALALPGCGRYYYGAHAGGGVSTDLVAANYQGVDVLLQHRVQPQQPTRVLVATLVPVDPQAPTSRLGRLFAEQIAGRLAQRGYAVTEFKGGGEDIARPPLNNGMPLPPALQAASQQYGAQTVVWGTYAVSQRTLYVSLKLFALDSTVLAASDYALPMDDDVRRLLAVR